MNRVTILFDDAHMNPVKDVVSNIKCGLEEAGLHVNMMNTQNVDRDVLLESDGIIFGCPTAMGGVTLEFKKLMDSLHNPTVQQLFKDKIAAGFTFGSDMYRDTDTVLNQLIGFASHNSMVWVCQGHIQMNEGAHDNGENREINVARS